MVVTGSQGLGAGPWAAPGPWRSCCCCWRCAGAPLPPLPLSGILASEKEDGVVLTLTKLSRLRTLEKVEKVEKREPVLLLLLLPAEKVEKVELRRLEARMLERRTLGR